MRPKQFVFGRTIYFDSIYMTNSTNDHQSDTSTADSMLGRIKKSVYKPDYLLLFILLAYFCLGYLLMPYYKYDLTADGVSYISIAQKYLNGNYSEAVNTYWSPLFSWLLVPFLPLSESPLISVRLLSLAIGFITLLSIRRLASRFSLSALAKHGLTIGLLPVILYGSLAMITPDLLMLCILALYLSVMFDMDYRRDKSKGRVCGVLGALAYLTKSYGFPFFIVHFIVFNVIHYYQGTATSEKQVVLKNLASGLIIFLLISGSWIFVISSKYNHFTISTSGSYNLALMARDSSLPELHLQLIDPANSNATSVWEEPSRAPVGTWNPLASMSAFKFYAKRVLTNIRRTYFYAMANSLFLNSIILFTVLFCLQFKRSRKADPLLFCVVTAIIYSSGYILIFVMPRYLWIVFTLFTIVGYYYIDLLNRKGVLGKTSTTAMLFVFCLSCFIPQAYRLTKFRKAGQDVFVLSEKIDSNYGISGKVASDYFWKKMLYLAFHNNYTYFGRTGSYLSDDKLQQTLRAHNIDYYFVWVDSLYNPAGFLSKQKEITGGEIKDLRIFDMKYPR